MNKPVMPKFPESWYKHCPKVLEAKEWHDRLVPDAEFVEKDYAECAFRTVGVGKECENCRKFLTRPFIDHKVDEEFLPLIEQFYRDMEEYDRNMAEYAKVEPIIQEFDPDELWGTIVALRWFKNESKINQQVSPEIRTKTLKLLDRLEFSFAKIST